MTTGKNWRNEIVLAIARSKHNSHMVEIISMFAADFSRLVYESLPKCQVESCNRPVTVKNEILNVSMCDHCCARTIYNSMRRMTGSSEDVLEVGREAAAREELWRDVENAPSIRRIIDHVEVIKNDEPSAIH